MSKSDNEETSIPTVSEGSNSLGEIRINHSVVANIVRLAALEVTGVAAVGGTSIVDGFTDIFKSKSGEERGVKVEADEVGDYVIEIRVILRFGCQLATVAEQVQEMISKQVENMTSNNVARVNVFIDGVRSEEPEVKDDWQQSEEQPHTD
ncbi:MAG: Asp23/Gls24 family envelope stress response protein [Lentimonas sp.]